MRKRRRSVDDHAELLRVGRAGVPFAERLGRRRSDRRSRCRGTGIRGCSRGARARRSRQRRSPAAWPAIGPPGEVLADHVADGGAGHVAGRRGSGRRASRHWGRRARSSRPRSVPGSGLRRPLRAGRWPASGASPCSARLRLIRHRTAARTSARLPASGVSSVFWHGARQHGGDRRRAAVRLRARSAVC